MAVDSAQVVDLSSLVSEEKKSVYSDVAIFKEVTGTPRILADSQLYITYTLKNSTSVRVLSRADNKQAPLKVHTTPIRQVKFVNYRSNVAASASQGEFFVWVVTTESGSGDGAQESSKGLEVRTYFKLKDPVTIMSFSWFVNSGAKGPHLLMRYDDKACIFNSAPYITGYGGEEQKVTLEENSSVLRTMPGSGALTEKSTVFTSVGAGRWFAFTVDNVTVIVCRTRNCNTPPWKPCEGAPIVGMELLQTDSPACLMVASENALYQWTIQEVGEPVLRRKFNVPGVVALDSTAMSLALFDNHKRCYVLRVTEESQDVDCSCYLINRQVHRSSISFQLSSKAYSVLADFQDRLAFSELRIAPSAITPSKDISAAIASSLQSSGAPAAKPTASPGSTAVKVDGGRVIQNLMHQLGLQTSKASPSPSSVDVTKTASAAPLVSKLSASPPTTTVNASPANDPAVISSPVPIIPRTGNGVTSVQKSTEGGAGGTVLMEALEAKLAANRAATPSSNIAQAFAANGRQTPSDSSAWKKASSFPIAFAPQAGAGAGAGTGAAATTAAAAAAAAKLSLFNNSLPAAGTDNALNGAMTQANEEVARTYAQLESALANATQILQLVPEMVRRDHEQLLHLGFEAQMTELQKLGGAGAASGSPASLTGAAGGGQSEADAAAFNSYLLISLIEPVARHVVAGTVKGIEEGLVMQLNHSVRHAMNDTVRAAQKKSMKLRIDEALTSSTESFITLMKQRFQTFAARELREQMSDMSSALNDLVEENKTLQTEMRLILNCGAVDDVRKLREDLKALRASVMAGGIGSSGNSAAAAPVGGNPSTFQTNQPTPETLLTTAVGMMKNSQFSEALTYINQARQPHLVLKLLAATQQNDDLYQDLLNDTSIVDSLWVASLDACAKGANTPQELECAAQIMIDVLGDRESILHNKTSTGATLDNGLKTFVAAAKKQVTGEGLRVLTHLEKDLQ